jgi:FMN phosphatase YigB (HAD superfamily)
MDIGGTLYRNEEFDAQFGAVLDMRLAADLGISINEAKARLKARMNELEVSEGDPSKVRAMSTFGIGRDEVHEIFATVDPRLYLGPEPSTVATLSTLADSGLRLAVLSNFRLDLVHRILRQLGVRPDIFEFMLTEDDGLPIKPSPVPFQEALHRFGQAAGMAGYVGDSLSKDIRPARDAGYTTFWVTPSQRTDPAASFTITNLSEILNLL